MKNNFLVTTIINVIVLVFALFMFEVFLIKTIAKHRFRLYLLVLTFTFLCFAFFLYQSWLFICLVKISGIVEKNPTPKFYSAQYLTICY